LHDDGATKNSDDDDRDERAQKFRFDLSFTVQAFMRRGKSNANENTKLTMKKKLSTHNQFIRHQVLRDHWAPSKFASTCDKTIPPPFGS
jgi:hypothetical protein